MNILNENGLQKLVEHLEKCSPGISKHISIDGDYLLIDNVILVAYPTLVEDVPTPPVQVPSNSNIQQQTNKAQQPAINPQMHQDFVKLQKKIDDMQRSQKIGSLTQPPQRGMVTQPTPIKPPNNSQNLPQDPNKPESAGAQQNNPKPDQIATDIIKNIGMQLSK